MRFPEESEFICVLGWDEELYQEALLWVDGKRRVAFICEEERESVDPRVKVYVLESPLQIEGLARKVAWSAVFRKLSVVGEGPFKEELEKCHLAADLILSEAADWGVLALKNARANRGHYRRGMELKGAFAGVPAVIVGAGPSLEKNGHLLKGLEDKALIFGAGSALNVMGIEPHFAGSIDAAAPHEQFKRHPFLKTPFCYQSRMNGENFSLVQGEKLLFPDSSSEAINWLYGEEPFDGGWTVGNFLTAVAVHFGCDPIVFVGMDLCYQEDRKYANMEADLPEGLIQVDGVWTQKDWLMAAKWTEELGRGRNFFNATGRGILRLPPIQLEGWEEKGDLRKKVREAIERFPLVETKRGEEWEVSLRRCQSEISEEEIVYQKLLLPLWQIWGPLFEREFPEQNMDIHQRLFFQQVLAEHGR